MVMLYHTGLVGCALFFYDFALTAFFLSLSPIFQCFRWRILSQGDHLYLRQSRGVGVRIVAVMISHRLLVGRAAISLMILLRQYFLYLLDSVSTPLLLFMHNLSHYNYLTNLFASVTEINTNTWKQKPLSFHERPYRFVFVCHNSFKLWLVLGIHGQKAAAV